MAISYPVTFPSSRGPTEVHWAEINNIAQTRSPYTGSSQVYDYGTGFWAVTIEMSNMTRAQAAPFIGFYSSMMGRKGTFTFGDTLFAAPTGVGFGASTPKVNGASQVGFTLTADDFSNSITGILLPGDMIQIENSLYRVLNTVSSDGSGDATIEVWPHLKSHADNAVIIATNPKGLFRMESNSNIVQYGDSNKLFDINIVASEVV